MQGRISWATIGALLLAAIFVAATVRKAPADLGGDRRGGAGVQSPVDRPETSGLMSKRG
jgi:hypothetical protein